jgi:hypothetical protein
MRFQVRVKLQRLVAGYIFKQKSGRPAAVSQKLLNPDEISNNSYS